MRRLSFFLLLATAAAPALAAPDEDNDRAERRAERRAAAAEQSESRPQRERVERPERSQPAEQRRAAPDRQDSDSTNQAQVQTQVQARDNDSVRNWRRSERNANRSRDGDSTVQTQVQAQDNDSVRNWRRSERNTDRNRDVVTETGQDSGALAPRQRRIRTIPETQPTASQPTDSREATVGTRHRRDYRDGNYTRWSRDHWRNDRRYDWRRHRDRNRSLFRLGFYYDPFGWSYRRFNIGFNLWPSHYSSRYWLNDPWRYRLPPAYGPYRWVRYWDDALLVNIYTGEVVDVMHNFFW